jgi:[CysO sulfur-carrier protein]-S-L-cysteine hydrolase
MNTFTPFRLVIPRPIYEALLVHALAELPAECCGLLAGRLSADGTVGDVTHHYPLVNELNSPTEFLSDPYSMLRADKAIRSEGTDVLAVYHSHPTSDPVPSRKDRERNYSPRVMNLIIGTNETPEVRAWWLTETDYCEGEWEVK